MGVLLFLINIQSEVIGPVEVIGLGDAGGVPKSRLGTPGEGLGQLLGIAVDPAVVKDDKDIFRRMLCPPFGFSFILPFSFCIVCNL